MSFGRYINGRPRLISTTGHISSAIGAPPPDHVDSEIGIPRRVNIRSNLRSLFSFGWVIKFKETPKFKDKRIPRTIMESRKYEAKIALLKEEIKKGNVVISDNIDFLDKAIGYVPILFGVVNTIINLTTATVSQVRPESARIIYVWTNFSTRLTTEIFVLFLIRALAFMRDASMDIRYEADISDQMLEDLILEHRHLRGENVADYFLFQGDPISYPIYVGLFNSFRDFLNLGWQIKTEERPNHTEKKKIKKLKKKIRNTSENLATDLNIIDRGISFSPLFIQLLVLGVLIVSESVNSTNQTNPLQPTTALIWSNFIVLLITQVPVIIMMQAFLFFRGNMIKMKSTGDIAYRILDKLFKYPNEALPPTPSTASDESLFDGGLLTLMEAAGVDDNDDEEAQFNQTASVDLPEIYSDDDSDEEDEAQTAEQEQDDEDEEVEEVLDLTTRGHKR